jgi:hypothetical protein
MAPPGVVVPGNHSSEWTDPRGEGHDLESPAWEAGKNTIEELRSLPPFSVVEIEMKRGLDRWTTYLLLMEPETEFGMYPYPKDENGNWIQDEAGYTGTSGSVLATFRDAHPKASFSYVQAFRPGVQ